MAKSNTFYHVVVRRTILLPGEELRYAHKGQEILLPKEEAEHHAKAGRVRLGQEISLEESFSRALYQ